MSRFGVSNAPRPNVLPCRCELWCDVCNGEGTIAKKKATLWSAEEREDCPTCKGNPQATKLCSYHAREAGWLKEEK